MNNQALQHGNKEAYNPQLASSPSGSISQFTEEEEQQKINALSEDDKLIKNQQLFLAIRKKKTYEEKVRKIDKYLEQGADIDAIDKNDNYNTPLHVAVLNYEPEIVSALLDRGALIHAKNSNGEIPVDIAERLQYQSIIEIFQARIIPHHISVKEKSISTSQIETRINFNQDNEVEYNPRQRVTKRSGAQGLHGQIYQLKLLMLFLKRGLDKKYSFQLSTENEKFKKFDDLIFEINNERGEKEYRLLQAKHKTDKSKKITFDNLLTLTDNDYSLVKYFFSYHDLKNNLSNKGIIKDVTVCTNIDFDLHNLSSTLKDVHISDIVKTIDIFDDILYFKCKSYVSGKRYQFRKKIVPLLKPLLLTYNLTRLAQRLADCVIKNAVIFHHQEPFNVYHIILAEEVIDTENKIFFNTFVNGSELSGETERFREIFKEILCEKLPGICFRNINRLIVESKLCFKLSQGFGYSKVNQNWPENAEDVKVLAQTLIANILKAHTIHTKGAFELYHAVLAKEVIDTKENKFLDQFVNGEDISENAKKFRNALEIESKLQGDISLKEINKAVNDNNDINKRIGLNLSKQFGEQEKTKTKNKKTHVKDTISDVEIECQSQGNFNLDNTNKVVEENLKLINKPVDDSKVKKNWPSDSISDEDINNFLDHLVFAVNQPNEDELGKLIENDIGQDFNFVAKDYVYNELFVRMLDWLNGKGEAFISYEDGKSLFDDVKNNLSELELTSISQEHQDELKKYDIKFKETFDSELCNFLKLSDTNIFHVITKDVTLSAIKVYTILTSIPEYKHCHNYIFMKLNSVLSQQNRVKQALKIPNNVLVITCKTASKDIHKQYNQLFNIMKSNNNKNIILISHGNHSMDQRIKSDSSLKSKYYEVIDASITFNDLSSNSQTNLLEKRAVMFQGQKISLGALITDAESKLLIEGALLSQLVRDDTVEVGNAPSKLDEMNQYFFMNRNLCKNVEEILNKEFVVTYNGNIRNSSFNESKDIVVISDYERDFEELCCTYLNSNIYWLRKVDEVLIGMRSIYKSKIVQSRMPNNWLNSDLSSRASEFIPDHLKNFCINSFRSTFNSVSLPDKIEYILSKNIGKEIKDISDNIVIVSADSGMGKSTMLAYAAQESKELNPLLWVEKIDLKDHTGNLENLKFPINLSEVINFLSGAIDLKTHFEKELFKLRVYKQGRIILLFDGFDEISPHYKKTVLELLYVLQSTKVERIWVTTRPHLKNDIEEKLKASSYTLNPLSIEEQQTFLENVFSKKFNISPETKKYLGCYSDEVIDVFSQFIVSKDKICASDIRDYEITLYKEFDENSLHLHEMHRLVERFKNLLSISLKPYDSKYVLQLIGYKSLIKNRLKYYTSKLLDTISTSICDNFRLFTGTPLHLKMLGEIFQDSFKSFYNSEEDDINFTEIFDLANNLHDFFMERKYKAYWKVNNKADLTIPSVLENYETLYLSWKLDLKLLAVSMLFDHREKFIFFEENKNKIDDIKRSIKDGKERAGIIRITSNDTLTFMHHSFSEYLAAEYIYDKLKFFSSTDNLWSFLDKTIFIKDYKNVRRFFEHKLTNDYELASLSYDSNSEVFYEEHLYVAVEENLVKLIELLLEIIMKNSYMVIIFKKIFIKVVDLAVFKNHKCIIEVLLKYLNYVDADEIIKNVTLKYICKAARNNDESMLDILLQYIENSDLIVQILKSVDCIEYKNMMLKGKNAVYNAVDNHRLTGNQAVFECIKKLSYDDRFNVLYSFEESVELTDHRMYFSSTCSPMHRAKQMADCCNTCGEECQQYLDLCSLMDGIWEVHEYLINYSYLSPLEIAKLLAEVIKRDWNTKNIIIGVLKTETDTRKKIITNTKMDNDKTIFHLACGFILERRPANLGMIEFLVDHEADMNVQDNDGRTPLHFAACACNGLEVVKYLVGKGADFTAVDSFGKTPLLLAYEMNNFKVVQYLVQKSIQIVLNKLAKFINV